MRLPGWTSRWLGWVPERYRRASAEELHAAEAEFAATRRYLSDHGFAAPALPAGDLEDQALQRSLEALRRVRAAELKPTGAPRGGADPTGSDRRTLRRPAVLAGLAVALVAAVVLGVVAPWSTPSAAAGTPPLLEFSRLSAESTEADSSSAARGLLLALAERAAAQPGLAAAAAADADDDDDDDEDEEYTVTSATWSLASSEGTDDGERAAVVPFQTALTVAADGSVVRVEQRGDPLTPDGRGAARGVDRLLGPQVQVDRFPPGYVDPGWLATVPREPSALRAALLSWRDCPERAPTRQAELGSHGSSCLVTAVADLYQLRPVPPDLQAALWHMLAADAAFRSGGSGADRAGRPCEAVVLQVSSGDATERWVLMADAATGAYLGVDHVLVDGSVSGVSAPAVLDFTTLLATTTT